MGAFSPSLLTQSVKVKAGRQTQGQTRIEKRDSRPTRAARVKPLQQLSMVQGAESELLRNDLEEGTEVTVVIPG